MPPEKFSRFQPIELSDPCYEHDDIRNLTFYSSALRGRGDVSIFVPPGCEALAKVPIVLLLHGVYGSHWSWFLSGGAHRTALQLITEGRIRPMILVSPSDGLGGDGTGYLPRPDRNYEAWICEDVLGCVREIFPCTAPDGPAFISGLSMGGYGALRLGAKYAERFKGISAHSAITKISEFDDFIREPLDLMGMAPQEVDLMHWMRRNRSKLSPVRLDCGTEDSLFHSNRALDARLDREGIPHRFIANSGDHSWPYWKTHIADTLLFFESILKSCS
jgi:putative tributyrin esterase